MAIPIFQWQLTYSDCPFLQTAANSSAMLYVISMLGVMSVHGIAAMPCNIASLVNMRPFTSK